MSHPRYVDVQAILMRPPARFIPRRLVDRRWIVGYLWGAAAGAAVVLIVQGAARFI